jgi:exopolysaccharide biosynthesis polyprenyl glycosylphosphotransferase
VVILLIIADILMTLTSYFLSFFLRTKFDFFIFRHPIPAQQIKITIFSLIVVFVSQLISFYVSGLYTLSRNTKTYKFILKDIFIACLGTVALIIIASFFLPENLIYQRSVVVVFFVFHFITVSVSRRVITKLMRSNGSRKNIIIIGMTTIAKSLISEIETNQHLRRSYNIVGVLSIKPLINQNKLTLNNGSFHNYPILGSKDDLRRVLDRYRISEVLIASENNWQDDVLSDLREYEKKKDSKSVRLKIIPSPYEIKIGKMKFSKIHDIPMFDVEKQFGMRHHYILKRLFDIVFGVILLGLSSPLLLISGIIIKLTSRGKVFYYQRRVGKNLKRFTIIKLRTMITDAEKKTGVTLSPHNDNRVTTFGKFLRATRIDELPQLVNVIKGDMSFVGPRPERAYFVRKFIKEIDSYSERFRVKPGLTGLAQIQGDYHTKPEIKLKYDLSYIYNWSYWLEIRILLDTVRVMLTRKGH